jgi:hypothetical protein
VRLSRAILPVILAAGAGSALLAPALAGAQSCTLAPLIPCNQPTVSGPAPPSDAEPAAKPAPPLEIGLTESDPRLLIPTGTPARIAFQIGALAPNYIRVLVPWERAQPSAGRRPNWDTPPGGCPRDEPYCEDVISLRVQLRAIKRMQALQGGWKILAVPYFTPPWAASKFTGCQKARHRHARSQLPRIGPYRRFLRALNALADKTGVTIDYITPWNEPNHPGFLQPQRATCDRSSKAISPLAYARLVRAANQELRDGQTLVVGSLAGLEVPRVYGAGAAEFIRGLPRDVVCVDGPFAQHAYIGEPGRRGNQPPRVSTASAPQTALLDDVFAALDAKHCTEPKHLWIAETGTFDHRCEGMFAALKSWARNDRIDAAFQYTFREARAFPVGLVSTSLLETYDSYRAWGAFAGGPEEIPDNPC